MVLFGSGSITGLTPGTTYYVRVRQGNAIGAGGWSSTVSFTTLSSVKINWNGAWVNAVPYVNINGQWYVAKAYTNIDGAWRV